MGVAVIASLVLVIVMVFVFVRYIGVGEQPAARRSKNLPLTTPPPPEPSPKPTPSKTVPVQSGSPFTGLPMKRTAPVLAVKIDNHKAARPHTNIELADIVYVEPVEGGLSRLMAVFSSRIPKVIGPVRSARESDLEILRQFGSPALAYSGAKTAVISLIRKAPVFDVSPARVGGPYSRGDDRPAPHNLYAKPSELLSEAPKASLSHDIGFRFGPAPAGGRPVLNRQVTFPAFRIGFKWSPTDRHYLVTMDGKSYRTTGSAKPGPTTVVIQQVNIRDSKYAAMRRSGSPYVETVGSGDAVVMRDGKAYDVRWSRPSPTSGTTFTMANGERMIFAPGQVWVVYDKR